MCGIAGFFSSNKEIPLRGFNQACNMMRHRGPDDEGYLCLLEGKNTLLKGADTVTELNYLQPFEAISSTHLLLAHRRLSIIDLSAAGHQPMVSTDGEFAICFNGEIFNFVEIRNFLENAGYIFHTGSDTEVVLNAWLHWGNDAFNKFNGMWAIAIWDNKSKSLTLSRDRFGVKPLYITKHNGVLYFASEMKTLRAIPNLSFSPNSTSVNKYLDSCSLNTNSDTFWSEIQEFQPGTWLTVDQDGNEFNDVYWKFTPNEISYSDHDALEKFTSIFEDSLKLRMRSDVEVGSLLSGGLDSNTIVGGLNKLGLIKNNNFKTFSAIFSEQNYSEINYIKETLNRIKLDSTLIQTSPELFEQDFSKLLHHIEEPFRSLSVYSQFKIYETIKSNSNVKVLLNGQGADELFGGYTGHYYYLIKELIFRKEFNSAIVEILKFKSNRSISSISIFKQLVRFLFNSTTNLNSQLFKETCGSPLREYLKYDDRNSMSASVEARTPFLDYRLVEFAFSLPSDFKIKNFINKKIIRDYAKNIVSPSIINRSDKMGFISPQELWQKNQLSNIFNTTFSSLQKNNYLFLALKLLNYMKSIKLENTKIGIKYGGYFAWLIG